MVTRATNGVEVYEATPGRYAVIVNGRPLAGKSGRLRTFATGYAAARAGENAYADAARRQYRPDWYDSSGKLIGTK